MIEGASESMRYSKARLLISIWTFQKTKLWPKAKSSSKVEQTGAPYSGLFASSIYVTHGWLELCHTRPAVFSSIYVIGQLYLSRTVHTTKNLARPFVLPY